MGKRQWFRSRLLWIVVIAVAGLASWMNIHLINITMPSSHSDLLPRVVGTQAALDGKDPYSRSVFTQIQLAYYGPQWQTARIKPTPQPYMYPAILVPLLAPFMRFSWETIRLGFLWIMPVGLLASGLLWVRVVRPDISWREAWVIALLLLISWPVAWGLRLQQLTLPVAILMAVACWFFWRGWGFASGFVLAICMIKPQLALPLALWMVVWTLKRKRWSFVVGFGIVLVVLLVVTERMVPGWMPHWLDSLHGYQREAVPILEIYFGKIAGLLATVVIGVWSIAVLYRYLKASAGTHDMAKALALALAATVFVMPTKAAMAYNQVFLFPGVILVWYAKPLGDLADVTRRAALMFLGWAFVSTVVSGAVGKFWPDFVNLALPFRDMFLPVVVLLALLALEEEACPSGLRLRAVWRRSRARVGLA